MAKASDVQLRNNSNNSHKKNKGCLAALNRLNATRVDSMPYALPRLCHIVICLRAVFNWQTLLHQTPERVCGNFRLVNVAFASC
eukprot:2567763-Amphidinium_carterae.1